VLLGGCATKESVEQAQSTADQAKSDAAGAHAAADRAQSSADGAAKMAQDAMSLAQQANDKVDKLTAQLEEKKHAKHRRHTASVSRGMTAAACPPNEQRKTELLQLRQQATNNKQTDQGSAVKTARN
jgi:hypothetical protein